MLRGRGICTKTHGLARIKDPRTHSSLGPLKGVQARRGRLIGVPLSVEG